MAEVNWNDARFKLKVASVAYSNAHKAGVFAVGKVKRSMRKGGQRRTKAGVKLPTEHSRPGQVPFTQSSTLKNSITNRVRRDGKEVVASFGSPVVYARRLEMGFFGVDKKGRNVQQLPRPYLRPVLRQFWPQLKKILLTGRPT